MISHPHQCIFVHIPKTAGNSINRVFGVGWEDHKDLQRYRDEVPPELFQSYFKFAVVRNPWDRLLSDYNYQRKKSRAKDSKLFLFTEGGSKRNFAEWVDIALTNPDRYEAQRWGGAVSPNIHRWSPQIDWICVDGQPRVDFVARLERLPEDFRLICQRLNLPVIRLPHRNRRLHWHYSHYYDRGTRDLVASYYARDIEYFGYEFEHSRLRLWSIATEHLRTSGKPVAPAASAPTVGPSATTAKILSWTQRSYAAIVATLAMFIGA
jgi:chondroitin 4-sulfotransferase 11